MHPRRPSRPLLVRAPATLILLLACGCDATPLFMALSGGSPTETLVVLAASASSDGTVSEIDGGNAFSRAQAITVPAFGHTDVRGRLDNASDIDTYIFGPASAGDLIVIDVRAGGADTRAALFDESGILIEANDDRAYYAGLTDPFIRTVLRRDQPQLFVAITGAADTNTPAGGADYAVSITRAAGISTPPPNPQVVWLEFGGVTGVRIAGEAPQDVPAFDVAGIHPAYKPQQAEIVERLVAKLREDYRAFNVVFLRSDRDARPGGAHTTLYFGGYSPAYLGLSDNVDYFNAEVQQEAIIYTDTLTIFAALRPSDEQVAQAIGNIAAHELGHLLGLEHTSDPYDLMSEATSALQVLGIDASFTVAPLARSVFPIGVQNSPQKVALGAGLSDPASSLDEFLQAHAALAKASATLSRGRAGQDDVALETLGLRMCARCALPIPQPSPWEGEGDY